MDVGSKLRYITVIKDQRRSEVRGGAPPWTKVTSLDLTFMFSINSVGSYRVPHKVITDHF